MGKEEQRAKDLADGNKTVEQVGQQEPQGHRNEYGSCRIGKSVLHGFEKKGISKNVDIVINTNKFPFKEVKISKTIKHRKQSRDKNK
jgi:hypothetical protein